MKKYNINDVEQKIKNEELMDISEYPRHLYNIIDGYFRDYFTFDGINKMYDSESKRLIFSEYAVNEFIGYYKKRVETYLEIENYRRLNFLTVSEACEKIIAEYGMYYESISSLRGTLIGYCKTNNIELISINYHNKQGLILMVSQESLLLFKEYYLRRKEVIDNAQNFYCIDDVRKLLHVTNTTILRYEKDKRLVSYFSSRNKKYYEKGKIDEIVEFRNNTINIQELSEKIKKSRAYIDGLADKNVITYYNDILTSEKRINKCEVAKIIDIITQEKKLSEAETQFQKYKISVENVKLCFASRKCIM